MSGFPDSVEMVTQRIGMMPGVPLVVNVLPVDFLKRLPLIHVTPGGGVESMLERTERVNVDVYSPYPPLSGEESAEALARRVHSWLVPGVSTWFDVPAGLADEVVCDPTPTTVPYQIDDVALVSAAYHVTSRRQ